MRFLLRWQHASPGTWREGRRGLLAIVEQLQGFELAAGAWEESVLPARVAGYAPAWLDALCLSGEVVWGRLALRAAPAEGETPGRGGAVPSRATPLAFACRDDLPWLLAAARGGAEPTGPGPGAAHDVLACLREAGALFEGEILARTGRLPVEVEEALWDLVSRGLVSADGFGAVRALLARRSSDRERRRTKPGSARARLRRRLRDAHAVPGRFALLPGAAAGEEREALAEAVAEQLLARWGVVFFDLLARETLAVPRREIFWALRRMEARGTARGGRFVTGFTGEQFALPGAVEALRQVRRRPRDGETVRLSAADPLNLAGIVTPGPRIPALRGHSIVVRDGIPAAAASAASG
jgi:ATP-dependent Lhr-like helicase